MVVDLFFNSIVYGFLRQGKIVSFCGDDDDMVFCSLFFHHICPCDARFISGNLPKMIPLHVEGRGERIDVMVMISMALNGDT